MGVDLGTYRILVELADGRGFRMDWRTDGYYDGGHLDRYPVDATYHSPRYATHAEVLYAIDWAFTDGNNGCDCCLEADVAKAAGRYCDEYECGDELEIKLLSVDCPDGSTEILIGTAEKEGE